MLKNHNSLVEFAHTVDNLCQAPGIPKLEIKKFNDKEICDLHDSDLHKAASTINRAGMGIFSSILTTVGLNINKERFEINYIAEDNIKNDLNIESIIKERYTLFNFRFEPVRLARKM